MRAVTRLTNVQGAARKRFACIWIVSNHPAMWNIALLPFRPLPAGERRYFHVVDVVRGFAAVAVVIFHYQMFYMQPGSTGVLDPAGRAAEPLYNLLWPMMDYGQWAVQLFWGISGFVFANVYAGNRPSAREFFARRVARLYPLHLLTLCVVAGLQLVILSVLGSYLLVGNNDLYHFALQLALVSNWGFQEGHSFNGPIWSVSAELASYALFWLLLPWLFRWGVILPLIIAAAAFALVVKYQEHANMIFLIYCAVYFFIGAAINHAVHALSAHRWLIALAAVMALAMFVVAGPLWRLNISIVVPIMVVAVLLSAATLELYGAGPVAARARAIGDSTYGIYLWHLPIQLMILLTLDGVIGSRAVLDSPWFLLAFVGSACLAGWLSYRYFEKPVGRLVLRRLLPKPANSTQAV